MASLINVSKLSLYNKSLSYLLIIFIFNKKKLKKLKIDIVGFIVLL